MNAASLQTRKGSADKIVVASQCVHSQGCTERCEFRQSRLHPVRTRHVLRECTFLGFCPRGTVHKCDVCTCGFSGIVQTTIWSAAHSRRLLLNVAVRLTTLIPNTTLPQHLANIWTYQTLATGRVRSRSIYAVRLSFGVTLVRYDTHTHAHVCTIQHCCERLSCGSTTPAKFQHACNECQARMCRMCGNTNPSTCIAKLGLEIMWCRVRWPLLKPLRPLQILGWRKSSWEQEIGAQQPQCSCKTFCE